MKLQLIFFKSWFLEYIIHIKNMIYKKIVCRLINFEVYEHHIFDFKWSVIACNVTINKH